MTVVEAIILGVVQGLTEFLPVSSSGHLVLAEQLMHVELHDITFEVAVHLGTLLAVITMFRVDLAALVSSLARAVTSVVSRPDGRARPSPMADANFRLGLWLVVGTLPAAIIGLALEDVIESAFGSPLTVSICLLITGTILVATRHRMATRKDVGLREALAIGVAQAVAILPGISRSGSTIATGVILGVEGRQAARFSFLLSVPVILGASVLKLGGFLLAVPTFSAATPLIVGAAAAYLSGYAAISLALDVIGRGRLEFFGYYCWIIGLAGLAFLR